MDVMAKYFHITSLPKSKMAFKNNFFLIWPKKKKKLAVFGAPRPTLNFCADPTTFFFQFDKEFYKKGNFCATCCKKHIENPELLLFEGK